MRDLLLAVVARTPLRLLDLLAWTVAWTWWLLVPVRRREGVANLRAALPDAHPRRTLVRMMHDLVLGYLEILQFDRLDVRVEGAEAVPPGSLLVCGHGGSWDVGLLAWADRIPLAVFLRPPKDAWARSRLSDLRRAHGVVLLEEGATMEHAWAHLAAGRSVMFIQDQRFHRGLDSPFFGRPAKTSAALAAAALRTGGPVWGCWQIREGVGRHRLVCAPVPLPTPTGDRTIDIQAATDAINRWYEQQIRAYPHGWLWLHRRWR